MVPVFMIRVSEKELEQADALHHSLSRRFMMPKRKTNKLKWMGELLKLGDMIQKQTEL